MFRENTTIAQGLIIAVFSMIVVFVILLIISFLIDLIAYLIKRFGSKNTAPSKKAQASSAQKSSCEEEEVAAVVAAIAAYLGRDNFTVKSVENKSDNSSWKVSAQINSTK